MYKEIGFIELNEMYSSILLKMAEPAFNLIEVQNLVTIVLL